MIENPKIKLKTSHEQFLYLRKRLDKILSVQFKIQDILLK